MNITRPLALSPRKHSKSLLKCTSTNITKLRCATTIQTPIKLHKSTHSMNSIKPLSPKKTKSKYKCKSSSTSFPKPCNSQYHAHQHTSNTTNHTINVDFVTPTRNLSFVSSPSFLIKPATDRYIANRSTYRGLTDRFNTTSPETISNTNEYRNVLKTELFFESSTKTFEFSSPNNANNKYNNYNINT
eukprot:390303_1